MNKNEAIETLKAKSNGEPSVAVEKKKVNIPQTFAGTKTVDVKRVLELYKDQIAQAIPKHLTADRVIQIATTLITRSPEIAQCSVESLVGAVMQASILGFEPVASLGQCYFVPFNNKKNGKREVQFIVGYRGMIELARRSGEVSTMYMQSVYANDDFEYEFGLDPILRHKPALEDRGAFKFAYAVCKFKDGGYAFEVLSKYDIDKIRKRSQAGSSSYSPWSTDYDEMAKKTVLRRLFKSLPSSISRDAAADEVVIKPEMFADGKVDENAIETAEYDIVDDEPTSEAQTTPEPELRPSQYPNPDDDDYTPPWADEEPTKEQTKIF